MSNGYCIKCGTWSSLIRPYAMCEDCYALWQQHATASMAEVNERMVTV
jgi:hypothetical protein